MMRQRRVLGQTARQLYDSAAGIAANYARVAISASQSDPSPSNVPTWCWGDVGLAVAGAQHGTDASIAAGKLLK